MVFMLSGHVPFLQRPKIKERKIYPLLLIPNIPAMVRSPMRVIIPERVKVGTVVGGVGVGVGAGGVGVGVGAGGVGVGVGAAILHPHSGPVT